MIDRLIKFILGGISNTIFSYLIYFLLVIFLDFKIAYFICTLASVIYTYKINTKLVFGVKSRSRIRYLYFIIYTFQILFGLFLIDLWVNRFLINKFFAPIINIIFISPIVFLLSNLLSDYLNRKTKMEI